MDPVDWLSRYVDEVDSQVDASATVSEESGDLEDTFRAGQGMNGSHSDCPLPACPSFDKLGKKW